MKYHARQSKISIYKVITTRNSKPSQNKSHSYESLNPKHKTATIFLRILVNLKSINLYYWCSAPSWKFSSRGWLRYKCLHLSFLQNSLSAYLIMLFKTLLLQYSVILLIHFTVGLSWHSFPQSFPHICLHKDIFIDPHHGVQTIITYHTSPIVRYLY